MERTAAPARADSERAHERGRGRVSVDRWMDGYIVQLQLVLEQTTGPVRYSLGEASSSSDRMCVLTGLAVL